MMRLKSSLSSASEKVISSYSSNSSISVGKVRPARFINPSNASDAALARRLTSKEDIDSLKAMGSNTALPERTLSVSMIDSLTMRSLVKSPEAPKASIQRTTAGPVVGGSGDTPPTLPTNGLSGRPNPSLSLTTTRLVRGSNLPADAFAERPERSLDARRLLCLVDD